MIAVWFKRRPLSLLSFISGGLLVVELLLPPTRHFLGFYAVSGVIICLVLSAAAYGLQKLAGRDQAYYDD